MPTTVEFGYTGTTTGTHGYTQYGQFTAPVTTSIIRAGVRTYTGGVPIKIGITDNSTWLAWGENTSSTSQDWSDVTFDTPASVTEGATYYVGFVADSTSFAIYSDSGYDDNYGNNTTNYRPAQYSLAFDPSSQGTPIVVCYKILLECEYQ